MDLTEQNLAGLVARLQTVSDPRQCWKVQYPLDEILFLTLSAVLSGCSEWQEVVDFGEDKLAWLRQYRPFANGIAAHDTINRCVSLIEPSAFEAMFVAWANEQLALPAGTLISLDGKRLRSSATKLEQQTSRMEGGKSALHVMHAWCGEFSLCLSARQVSDKSNEISAIPLILNDLDISGCVVSMDAMGCQKEVTSQVLERGADYVLALKQNQPKLFEAVGAVFSTQGHSAACFADSTVDHGRVEERQCRVLAVGVLPDEMNLEPWAGLASLVEIKSERAIIASAEVSHETRYYISSLSLDPETLATYIRSHWGVENNLHWALDVILGEDNSRKRVRNAAFNFGTILRIALNLLKTDPDTISLKRKIKKAARSDDYRDKLLKIK